MKIKALIIALAISLHVFADDTIKYVNNAASIGFGKSNISFLSPITYTTCAVGFTNQKTNVFPNKEKIFFYKTEMGLHANVNQNIMFDVSADALWGQYHTISYVPASAFNLYVGYAYWGDGGVYIKPDNINNVLYTHINNMAAMVIVASKHYRNMYFKNTFSMPLYGVYYGSSFSQNIPGIIEKENTIWEACKFGSFNINTQLSNNFTFDIRIKHKKTKCQTLRIEYSIEYAKLQLNNNVKQTVLHEFKFSTLINKSFYNHEF